MSESEPGVLDYDPHALSLGYFIYFLLLQNQLTNDFEPIKTMQVVTSPF